MTAPIDLRSDTDTDTATRPTDALRAAMAWAPVPAGGWCGGLAVLVVAQCAADMLNASDHPSGHCRGPTDGWLAKESGLR